GACAWRSVGLRCDARRHVRGDGRESLRRLAPPAQRADVRARGGAGKGAAGVVASPRRVRGVAGRARRGGRRVGRAASGDAHVRVLPAVEAVPARAGGQIGASGRRRECARPERALTTATARNYGGAFGRTGARGGRGGAGAHTDCDTLSNRRIAVQRNALRPGVSVICL
ncbi:hypothetical protein EMIHUDRAFT_440168, partial [Emiliania huxleyi CCMP1516]